MIRKTSKYILPAIIITGLLLISCGKNLTYTESYPMTDKTWPLMDIKSFNIQVTDTITINNLFFTIRSGADYPFRNIFLFVSASTPDGRNRTDTIEYYLSDYKGNWLGKGISDVHELKLPYRSNIYFPTQGEYVFKVQHGMRVEDLKGIYDIGMRVEKTGK